MQVLDCQYQTLNMQDWNLQDVDYYIVGNQYHNIYKYFTTTHGKLYVFVKIEDAKAFIRAGKLKANVYAVDINYINHISNQYILATPPFFFL